MKVLPGGHFFPLDADARFPRRAGRQHRGDHPRDCLMGAPSTLWGVCWRARLEISRNPCRDRSYSASRSVVTEPGDRSGSGSRSVAIRVEIGRPPVRGAMSRGWRPYESGRTAVNGSTDALVGRDGGCCTLACRLASAETAESCGKAMSVATTSSLPCALTPLIAHGNSARRTQRSFGKDRDSNKNQPRPRKGPVSHVQHQEQPRTQAGTGPISGRRWTDRRGTGPVSALPRHRPRRRE